MDWPPLLSPGGEAASCASSVASATAVRLVFSTVPTALGTSARHKSIMDYQTAFKVLSGPYFTDGVLWSDPSGGALIGEWGHGLVPSADSAGPTIGHGLEIGVISHGTFTPLRFPASLAETTPTTMAW
jgi:hypothetical protein